LEIKQQQLQHMNNLEGGDDVDQSLASTISGLQLTMLSSKSSTHATHRQVDGEGEEAGIQEEEEGEVRSSLTQISSTEQPSTKPQPNTIQSTDSHHSASIPNTKLKWTGSELSKMRLRWWDAVRAKQTEFKEDQKHENGAPYDEQNSLSSSSSSSGGYHATSYSSSDDDEDSLIHRHPVYSDPMQPPSLNNAPFDEMDNNMNNASASTTPLSPVKVWPESSKVVPQSILDLEHFCIESSHPLHCAIYNHALKYYDNGILRNHCNGNINSDNSQNNNFETTETEVVLRSLLTMQGSVDVLRWKNERVCLTAMRGLEANTHCLQDSRVDTLLGCTSTNPKALLSADRTSLTPLQLAIYWNQPRMVRLLCDTFASKKQQVKKAEEEDEHGRTPLMLACELGHVDCIQAILCASVPKLDRREREGGNTAFHFCCMGKLNDGQLSTTHLHEDAEDDILRFDTSTCVDSIDMLLKHTPLGQQKRAFMLTNCNGQNLLHLACSRGDLRLVECLLDRGNLLPGVKISKALDAKDRLGYTPFLAAVSADA